MSTVPWFDPRVDGRGSWTATPSHGLRLTALGTFVVCLLMALAFLVAVAIGRQAMCATHRDVHGHGALSYCPDYSQTRTTP